MDRIGVPDVALEVFFITLAKMRFPGKCKEQDLAENTGKNEIPQSVGVFSGFYCPPTQISPASSSDRSSCLADEAEFPGKCYS